MKQQAEDLHRQMEQTLEANPGGGLNPEALRRIQTLASHLKWTSWLFSEKAASFVNWAEILYSRRKHAPWNSHDQTGAEAIAHFKRCDLASTSRYSRPH